MAEARVKKTTHTHAKLMCQNVTIKNVQSNQDRAMVGNKKKNQQPRESEMNDPLMNVTILQITQVCNFTIHRRRRLR